MTHCAKGSHTRRFFVSDAAFYGPAHQQPESPNPEITALDRLLGPTTHTRFNLSRACEDSGILPYCYVDWF